MPARTAVTFQFRVRVCPAGTGPTVHVFVSAEFELRGASFRIHTGRSGSESVGSSRRWPKPSTVTARFGISRESLFWISILRVGLVGEVLAAGEGGGDDVDLELALGLVLVLLLPAAGAQGQGECCQRPCQHAGA